MGIALALEIGCLLHYIVVLEVVVMFYRRGSQQREESSLEYGLRVYSLVRESMGDVSSIIMVCLVSRSIMI